MRGQPRQLIFLRFADLLDYPGPGLPDRARECAELLKRHHPEAAEHVAYFVEFAKGASPGRLEEIYTSTFDLNPACYIFAGYLLFGESFKRGKFLVGLQERYRERGFSAGNELADHLAVLFRFLATLEADEALARELLEDCLLPALVRMNKNFKHDQEKPNPYARVLQAVLSVVEQAQARVAVSSVLAKEDAS